MFDCHQDERSFWKTMNPARLHALFSAYFRRPEISAPRAENPHLIRDQAPERSGSLAAYLMGGL